jgi:septum formation protein
VLVLASQSPRRAELLRQAGIPFVIRPALVDETPLAGEQPAEYVQRLAEEKARAVTLVSDETVLGADTTVVVGNRMLAKPVDAADAAGMLEALSGRCHEVLTGICLRTNRGAIRDLAITRVWFAALTPGEIEDYASSGEPLDKAGGYAIQGLASKFIERIEGCYFNVVGLPVPLVYRHLRNRWACENCPWYSACAKASGDSNLMTSKQSSKTRTPENAGIHGVHKRAGHGRKSTGETEGQFARDSKGRRGQYGSAGNAPLIKK